MSQSYARDTNEWGPYDNDARLGTLDSQRNFQELIYPNHLEHVSCWWKRLGHYHASSPLLLRYIVIVPSCSHRGADY